MNIRILKKTEKNRIRPLYEEIFKDSQEFVNYYFDRYIINAINFVCEEQDEIIGMAAIHEKRLSINGERKRAGYVYAVATAPAYRRRGVMKKLLDAIYAYAYENAYEYLYLIPENPKVYEGLSYILLREKKEFIIKKSLVSEKKRRGLEVFKVTEVHIDKCLEFLGKSYQGKVSIYYDKDYLLEILQRFTSNNSGIYCIFDKSCDKISGLAFIEDNNQVNLIDFVGDGEYRDLYMTLIMEKLYVEEMSYKINDIMFRNVHGDMVKLLEYSICINDEV